MANAAMRAAGGPQLGRPTMPLTDATRAAVLDSVRAGADPNSAAAAGGANIQTMQRWLVDYPAFALEYKKSQGEHITRTLSELRELPAGRWQARAWELERLYPERFGTGHRPDQTSTVRVEISAQICAQMADSWKTFKAKVIDAEDVTHPDSHNSNYIQLPNKSKVKPSNAHSSDEESDDAPPKVPKESGGDK